MAVSQTDATHGFNQEVTLIQADWNSQPLKSHPDYKNPTTDYRTNRKPVAKSKWVS